MPSQTRAPLAACALLSVACATAGTAPVASAPAPAAPAPAPAPVVPAAPSAAPPARAAGTLAGLMASPDLVPVLFLVAFYPGGIPIGGGSFKPGQYVRWSIDNPGHSSAGIGTIERARLADDTQGNQWWKVKIADTISGQVAVIEGLMGEDHKLTRLRARLPGDAKVREIDVSNAPAVGIRGHMTPAQFGATDSGTETVVVPAGTFSAHHYVFGAMGSAGPSLELWLSDQIPGGIIKQTGRTMSAAGGQSSNALLELQAFGSGATSELGSN